eukprot:955707_1
MKMSGLGGALIMDDLDDVNDLVDEEDEDEKESDTASVGWNDELLDEMKVQFGVVRDKLKLKGKVASSVRRLNAFTTAYGLIYGVGFNANIGMLDMDSADRDRVARVKYNTSKRFCKICI